MKNNTKNIKNKRHAEKGGDENKQREKKFDKKKYRLQKYSNRYKIDQWEERRKKAILRGFYKELQKDQLNSAQTSLNSNNTFKNADKTIGNLKKKGYAFYKAKQEYQRKQEEKRAQRDNAIRVKAERQEALKKYKEKKIHNSKLLLRKTKKGQPIMKGRAEMLLAKIQQSLT